jgi:HipA-like protein
MASEGLRTILATRYALALREGGSMPAIVEADDLGLYVVKFRGAGQGVLALVAELVAGEIGRALGLAVPELVFADVDAALGRNDPDAEIRHLLKASVGLNLALDYLPGSTMFDRAAGDVASADVASMAVWFDAFVQNVDRTARNPNLLMWHRKLYLIDHGAALYFHHNWETAEKKAESPFAESQHHVLLPWASTIGAAAAAAKAWLNAEVLRSILELVPAEWLVADGVDAEQRREAYVAYLTRRLTASVSFEEEAIRAYERLV